MKKTNKSLLGKWVWRYRSEKIIHGEGLYMINMGVIRKSGSQKMPKRFKVQDCGKESWN